MSDRSQDELAAEDELTVDRRGLLVKGGLAAAGATFLASPAAAFARSASASAGTIKVAVVTHGDTGSFWSVFKKGVDQAAKDLKGRGVSVTQVKRVHLVTGDIGETAVRCRRGDFDASSITPFQPVRFMLASPVEAASEAFTRMGAGAVWNRSAPGGWSAGGAAAAASRPRPVRRRRRWGRRGRSRRRTAP